MSAAEALLTKAYAAYNRGDFADLAVMLAPDVDWPNVLHGGRLIGRDAVLAYWRATARDLVADIAPLAYSTLADGRTAVEVIRVVRSVKGPVWSDIRLRHIYTLREGLIAHMDAVPAPGRDGQPGDIGP